MARFVVSLNNSVGICPVNLLELQPTYVRAVSKPNSVGIDPVSKFELIAIVVRAVSKPNCVGIDPVSNHLKQLKLEP